MARFLLFLSVGCLWLLLSCSLSHGTETDVACLRSLHDSLMDPHGYLNSTWNVGNHTEGFICTFLGVECWHPDENRVLRLRLSDMGIKGRFPRGLNMCTSITGVDLSGNKFFGPIPDDVSHMIGYITSLDLSSNKFSGKIPVGLANCSYLNSLKLDHNKLSGLIPQEFSLLNRLQTFNVSYNLLSGRVPYIKNIRTSAANYANNPGLCGGPLVSCSGASKSTCTGVLAGVTVVALVMCISMLFYY